MPKIDALATKLLEALREDHARERQVEIESIHNEIAEVLARRHVEIADILYILELLKFELLKERYGQIFEQPKVE